MHDISDFVIILLKNFTLQSSLTIKATVHSSKIQLTLN